MNRAQADKIISIIEKDATGKGEYFPTEDTECVLGGLSLAINGERRMLRYQELEREYGLSSEDQCILAGTNDFFDDIPERRAALIALVNSWVE